jgi:cell division protease FtsH
MYWADFFSIMLTALAMTIAMVVSGIVVAVVYGKVMSQSFNKTSYKAADATDGVRFADVLGVDEAKREAQEIVDFLQHADELKAIGARAPKGILLVGPPGTGKTMIAKAIAKEAGVPFYSLSGSDFNEVFVGVGAARIRRLYKEASKHKAAIVFIDEIDALGRSRSANQFGGQESNNTLNAFLVEMDGFGKSGNVITIGATNYEESLDAALLRPGRFDRRVYVGLPNLQGRQALLSHYMEKVKHEPSLDAGAIARATPGLSGAEIASIVNEASIMAVRDGRKRLNPADVNKAIERLGIGQEQAKTIGPKERTIIAYHEAGHAVVDFFSESPKRLHKISIIPTGQSALGYTWTVHTEDKHLTSRTEYIAEIAALYGGRLAEEMLFGSSEVTSGASSDLQRASRIAEVMVWDLGYAPGYPGSYRNITTSETTKRELDEAVGLILAEGQALARAILTAHQADLEAIAQALLAQETLNETEVESLIGRSPKHDHVRQDAPNGHAA